MLHLLNVVEPVRQYEPIGQYKQPDSDDSPAVPLYRPAGHSVTADAPSPQYPPAVPHGTQSVAPPLDWYVPAAHLVHAPCPDWSLNVPVLQAVCAVLPMLQYVPASQLAHPDAADSPTALLYRPAAHSVTADAPCRQYPPALHCTQPDAPVDG